jgi:iron-sulfur cluster assembly protein
MAILLTESAADRVRSHLAQRGMGLGLRVGIKKTGCSGFAYVVNYADEIHPDDAVLEAQGVKVVVDPLSLPLIDGTLVDFVKQGLNEAFRLESGAGRMRLRRVLTSKGARRTARRAPVKIQGFSSNTGLRLSS